MLAVQIRSKKRRLRAARAGKLAAVERSDSFWKALLAVRGPRAVLLGLAAAAVPFLAQLAGLEPGVAVLYLIPVCLIAARGGSAAGAGASIWAFAVSLAGVAASGRRPGLTELLAGLVGLAAAGLLGRLKDRQAELERSQRQLAELSLDAVLLVEPGSATIVSLSSAVERQLGWAPARLKEQPLRALFGAENEPALQQAFARALEGERTSLELDARRPSGESFPVELAVVALGTEPERLALAMRDLSEMRIAAAERAEIERARAARQDAERSAERTRALQALADVALSHVSIEALLAELTEQLGEVLGVEIVAFLFLDEAGETLSLRAGRGLEQPVGTRQPLGVGIAGRIMQEMKPLSFRAEDLISSSDPLLAGRASAALAAPLEVSGELIGVLEIGSQRERYFPLEEAALLRLAADRIALAIAHARLFEREQEIAQTLQQGLLPDTLPEIPGVELGARYLPGEADVGGDWYDAIKLPGNQLVILMGDVIGHGIGAAAAMGQLRSAMRAYALSAARPADLVTKLNEHVLAFAPGRITTLICVLFERERQQITYSCAGHLPPLVQTPDGQIEFPLEGRGLPLGVRKRDYQQATRPFPAGSLLLVYTDGLAEKRGMPIEAGLERIKNAVASGPRSAAALCDHLKMALSDQLGGDDTALLALRFNRGPVSNFAQMLPADMKTVREIRVALQSWLEGLGASPQMVYEFSMACSEACANAVEHASPEARRRFFFEARSEAGLAEVTVRDYGNWKQQGERPGRGNGMRLMEALSDKFEIQRAERGTVVRLSRKIEPIKP